MNINVFDGYVLLLEVAMELFLNDMLLDKLFPYTPLIKLLVHRKCPPLY